MSPNLCCCRPRTCVGATIEEVEGSGGRRLGAEVAASDQGYALVGSGKEEEVATVAERATVRKDEQRGYVAAVEEAATSTFGVAEEEGCQTSNMDANVERDPNLRMLE
ncbi:hypothetical protein B296_00027707 [Ensete ventricosum]|uniref:Uncharacterized protein n=1 Tax=Ensete ventricosum TaxID=4639 RepID=A0A426Y3X4_ENSVE|nr:hypothetical protein B296_00027707 [Ensete ventricosum]